MGLFVGGAQDKVCGKFRWRKRRWWDIPGVDPYLRRGGASGGWLMRCLFDRERDKQMDAFERCCGESWLDGWMVG